MCDDGSPGGHNNECFSKYFLPSNGSFISCNSSIMTEVPLRRVLVLFVVVPRMGELLLLSAFDLLLLLGAISVVIE